MIYLETERNDYMVNDKGDVEFTKSCIVDFDIRKCKYDGYSEFCKYVKEITKHMTDTYELEWQVVCEDQTTKEDGRGEYELYYAAIECEEFDSLEYELHGQYRKVK